MGNRDPELWQHQEWLGLVQPVGLLVSPLALVRAQASIDRAALIDLQTKLARVVEPWQDAQGREAIALIDFLSLATAVLGWEPEDWTMIAEVADPTALDGATWADRLRVALPDYGEILEPSWGVLADPGQDPADPAAVWLLLGQEVARGVDLDGVDPAGRAGWAVSPQAKFERLLREVQVPIGILSNGLEIRLVYAPRGESSGYGTFSVAAMAEVGGRPMLGALEMLLGAWCLFQAPADRRLPEILSQSRAYQAEVSTKLASQVLDALWELLRGFQAAVAIAQSTGRDPGLAVADLDPHHLYGGLLTTLMRLVFLLYAEDEGLMPGDPVYQQNYAVSGLYERLREDAGNFPDTLDQRYGAWAWLLSLFRLVYDGGGATPDYLPARHGQLFDPAAFPFLEGRDRAAVGTARVPRIADGVVFRVLDRLLMLDGEKLSYRSLDVEQIGSVYEAIMGYEIHRADGPTIALRPKDVAINLDELLACKPSDRVQWLQVQAECKVTGAGVKALQAATSITEVLAALGSRVSARSPDVLPAGTRFLQPGAERRRSGSHYTPRSLTEPMVARSLEPVLALLGDRPSADDLLELRVCDPAMGSGAFLVAACRDLGDRVAAAWARDGLPDTVPVGVEPVVWARRLVAQRCLYGVDRNPAAVSLAKLALWLITLARDLPFTFVDHALKCGDSLVGLTAAQIGAFVDAPAAQLSMFGGAVADRLTAVRDQRVAIRDRDSRDDAADQSNRDRLATVDRLTDRVRGAADLAIAAQFDARNRKERDRFYADYQGLLLQDPDAAAAVRSRLRDGLRVWPFHWDLEFPEVFDRPNPGFDAIVGNPPFMGGGRISSNLGDRYLAYLKDGYPESGGQTDLAAYFFRRSFHLLRYGGAFGLIATNTIAQGDTRSAGLRYLCHHGALIFDARRRVKWPGLAAVVVSIIHVFKQGV